MNKLLTTRQVAKVLQVDILAVYRYIHSGELKAHKLGGNGNSKRHWRVRQKDLDTFITGDNPLIAESGVGRANTEANTKKAKQDGCATAQHPARK